MNACFADVIRWDEEAEKAGGRLSGGLRLVPGV